MMKILKNYLFLCLLLCSISLIWQACSKDKNDPVSDPQQNETVNLRTHAQLEPIKVEENRLIFNTREHYESVMLSLEEKTDQQLDEWETALGFNSMRKQYMDAGNIDNMPVDDKFIATTLNTEGIIEIQNRIYKIDMPNKRVFIICDGDKGKIPLFAQGKV